MKKTYGEFGTGGIGFCGALTLLFIAMKLMGAIDWSWVWVLSPLWIPFAIVLGIMLLVVVVGLVVALLSGDDEK